MLRKLNVGKVKNNDEYLGGKRAYMSYFEYNL